MSRKTFTINENTPSLLLYNIPPLVQLINAYYDKYNNLLEIEIMPTKFGIPRKLLCIINVCLPFHPKLYKLILRRNKINYPILKEIGKLLPFSKFTDIYFDNTKTSCSDYSILLEKTTSLQFLSLRHCNIDSAICKNLISQLKYGCPAEKNFAALDLSSNNIDDLGAKYIGETLRSNRNLLHLNVADNNLTDIGASYILDVLIEFPLTYDEILERRGRHFQRLKEKLSVPTVETETPIAKNVPKSQNKSKIAKKMSIKENTIILPEIPKYVIDELEDPFSFSNTITKDEYVYCTGNRKLTSLNLAYNDIELGAIKKIKNVVNYQQNKFCKKDEPGLIRVIIEGNLIPNECDDVREIENILKEVYAKYSRSLSRSRPSQSTSSSSRRSKLFQFSKPN